MAYTSRFTDDFTEASDTALTSHTPSGGTSWTRVGPSTGGVLTVDSATNSVDHPFAGGGNEHRGYTADFSGTWEDDQEAEGTGGWAQGMADSVMLATRIQSDGAGSADGYVGWHDGGANQWRISRLDSGTLTNIGNFFDSTPSDTDVIILRSEQTDQHFLFENGTERINVTDSTNPGGEPGLSGERTYDGQGMDDFVGRDQAAAGVDQFYPDYPDFVLEGDLYVPYGPTR